MTVYTINFFVGFLVAVEDYLKALGKDFSIEAMDPVDREEKKRIYHDDPNWAKCIIKEAKDNYINQRLWENKLPITPTQNSIVLRMGRLTHDINKDCPLVLGVNLGCIFSMERYSNIPIDVTYTIRDVLEAHKKLELELEKIKIVNPKMYELIKDKEFQIIMVQDECRCCHS